MHHRLCNNLKDEIRLIRCCEIVKMFVFENRLGKGRSSNEASNG